MTTPTHFLDPAWGLDPASTPQEAVEELVQWFAAHHLADAQHINNGLCEDFAEMFMGLMGRGEVRWTPGETWSGGPGLPAWARTSDLDAYMPGHDWVELDGRHYDSETPDGVTDWRDLPLFKREAEQRKLAREV